MPRHRYERRAAARRDQAIVCLETLARLRSRSCIIDGEAVACDDNGVASFSCGFKGNRKPSNGTRLVAGLAVSVIAAQL